MKKAKQKEFEAIKTLVDREFDRLYERAIERLRRDPEKKKILDVLDPPAKEKEETWKKS
jgi:hypothetical protein